MLPKFLIADNSQEFPELVFVVHTQSPRCIVQGSINDFNDDQKIHWIDTPLVNNEEIEVLTKNAYDFFIAELENQEALYDEDDIE